MLTADQFRALCKEKGEALVYALAHIPDRVWFPENIYETSEIFEITKSFYDKKKTRLHLARGMYSKPESQEIIYVIDTINQKEDFIKLADKKVIVLNSNLYHAWLNGISLESIVANNFPYFSYLRKKVSPFVDDFAKLTDLDILEGILPLLLWIEEEVKYFKFHSEGNNNGYYFALKAL